MDQHEGMTQAIMDIASRQGSKPVTPFVRFTTDLRAIDVERSAVEVVGFVGPDSVTWAGEHDGLTSDSFDPEQLPQLPFTASCKPDKAFAMRLRNWLKACLSESSSLLRFAN
jgi:hypothetical protein